MLEQSDRLAFERLLQWLRLTFLASPLLVLAAFGAAALASAALIAAVVAISYVVVAWLLRYASGTLLARQLWLRGIDGLLVCLVLTDYHAFLGDAYYDAVYLLFVVAGAATHGRRGAVLLGMAGGAGVLASRTYLIATGRFAYEARHLTDSLFFAILFITVGLAVAFLMEWSGQAVERREATFREELASRNSALSRLANERDRALREAHAALQGRDAFLAAASHDLKNPLTVILGSVQSLLRLMRRGQAGEHEVQPERIETTMERVEHAATRMLAQLDEMVNEARTGQGQLRDRRERFGESGRVGLPAEAHALDRPGGPEQISALESVDLVDLVLQAVASHQEAAGGRQLAIETREESLVGPWDPVKTGRVLDNLLSNAIKYSPDRSPITVALWREERSSGPVALVSVRDRGAGIPEAEQPRVFEPFFRASNVAAEVPGTGVGLSASRTIVEQMGGTITLRSCEGEGSEFTVALPMEAAAHDDA